MPPNTAICRQRDTALPCPQADFSSQEVAWLYLHFQSGHGRQAGSLCPWPGSLLMALSCFLCLLLLPQRGGGSGGTCWSCSPHALGTPAFRGTVSAPAAEASSAASFWVTTGLLLPFWPNHPVPVDTSHGLWSSFCSHRDDGTTGCLHHP